MTGRNFIIVDDMPVLGEQVNRVITQFYNSKHLYNYDIKQFFADTHFADAKNYIDTRHIDIDIIFSDQNLRGGNGTDLFKAADKFFLSEYESILSKTKIFKVMHSNEDRRFIQYQSDHAVLYDYFVNSESEAGKDINLFLNFYEEKILLNKKQGNKEYRNFLYEKSLLQSTTSDTVELDRKKILISDIQFLIMDKDANNSDYYHCFYDDGEQIKRTEFSRKITFNDRLKELGFFSGNLREGRREKFKINPQWVSNIDKSNSVVKFIPKHNIQFEIVYEKLKADEKLFNKNIELFFTR